VLLKIYAKNKTDCEQTVREEKNNMYRMMQGQKQSRHKYCKIRQVEWPEVKQAGRQDLMQANTNTKYK
jgi:hypothetical protein